MGRQVLRDIDADLDEIDRRIRILSLSDDELNAAREALTSPLFDQSGLWLKIIDDELLRREMFPGL